MDLYTSLVQLKMALNGGQLPAMTPIPEATQRVIDPAFTIGGNGLGGLVEDEVKGLRCPVRGCGGWYHCLTSHANARHADLGGAIGIKALMDIPASASLASTRFRAAQTARNLARDSAQALARWRAARPGRQAQVARSLTPRRIHAVRMNTRTIGYKNLLDRCPAQLAHKLIDLQHQLGRSPSAEDARAVYGPGFVDAAKRVYGSWNNLKAQCGMERWKTSRKKWTKEQILAALEAWAEVHGDLPSALAIRRKTRAPLIPMNKTSILAAFETESWPVAMRRAALRLGIISRRFSQLDEPQNTDRQERAA